MTLSSPEIDPNIDLQSYGLGFQDVSVVRSESSFCDPETITFCWFWMVRRVVSILGMAKLAVLSKDLLPPA